MVGRFYVGRFYSGPILLKRGIGADLEHGLHGYLIMDEATVELEDARGVENLL